MQAERAIALTQEELEHVIEVVTRSKRELEEAIELDSRLTDAGATPLELTERTLAKLMAAWQQPPTATR